MKIKMLLVSTSLVMASLAHASPESSASTNMCFFSGVPSSDVSYTIIKNVKVGKGTYGPVTDVLPLLAAQASKLGADAIINYSGSQRFGFWPWRFVRPVVRGVAIKWNANPAPGCDSLGGTLLSKMMTENVAPRR